MPRTLNADLWSWVIGFFIVKGMSRTLMYIWSGHHVQKTLSVLQFFLYWFLQSDFPLSPISAWFPLDHVLIPTRRLSFGSHHCNSEAINCQIGLVLTHLGLVWLKLRWQRQRYLVISASMTMAMLGTNEIFCGRWWCGELGPVGLDILVWVSWDEL